MDLRRVSETSAWRYETAFRLYFTLQLQAQVQGKTVLDYSLTDLAGLMWTHGIKGAPTLPAKTSISDALMRLEAEGLVRTGVSTQGRTTIELLNGAKSMKKKESKTVSPNEGEVVSPNDPPPLLDVPPELPFKSAAFAAAWDALKKHRREIKYPLTPRAAELIIKQCREWGEDYSIQSIEQSIMNGWRGLFPMRGGPGGNSNLAARKAAIVARQKRLEQEEA